jgi:uncharacterized protein YjiS (DUF1127 family)
MAVFDTSRALNEGVRVNAPGFVSTLLGSFMAWNDKRVTRKALAGLTTRELNDIGLTHSDLANL